MQENTGEKGNGETEMTRHVELTGETGLTREKETQYTGETSVTNGTYHLCWYFTSVANSQ